MPRLESRVAIVTGAARGIGEAIARVFAAEGAAVVVADVDEIAGKETAARLAGQGARAIFSRCDVGRREDAERCIQHAIDEYGRVDVLVNNAGIARDSPIHRMTDDQWFDVLRVDLYGVFVMTQLASRSMVAQKFGRIVNVSSLAGISGVLGGANYAAAKAGVIGFTKSAAREFARYGISVNCVVPGAVETDILKALPENVRQEKTRPILLGRAAQPDEIARIVLFLASDDASYINGQAIVCDGGRADKL